MCVIIFRSIYCYDFTTTITTTITLHTLHYITLHSTPLRDTTLQLQLQLQLHLHLQLHYITLDYTTLNYTTLHYLQLQLQLHDITLHYTTLHHTTPHHTTLHFTTLHYTSLHYNYNYTTLHYTNYITLRYANYITLHNISQKVINTHWAGQRFLCPVSVPHRLVPQLWQYPSCCISMLVNPPVLKERHEKGTVAKDKRQNAQTITKDATQKNKALPAGSKGAHMNEEQQAHTDHLQLNACAKNKHHENKSHLAWLAQ